MIEAIDVSQRIRGVGGGGIARRDRVTVVARRLIRGGPLQVVVATPNNARRSGTTVSGLLVAREVVEKSNPSRVPKRIEPERSITRAMSRGRWAAWAVAVTFGRSDVPKILLNAARQVAVRGDRGRDRRLRLAARRRVIGAERLRGLAVVVRAVGERQLRRRDRVAQDRRCRSGYSARWSWPALWL